jgi:hypothetical protein
MLEVEGGPTNGHLEQDYTKAFIAFHQPEHLPFRFETINAEP